MRSDRSKRLGVLFPLIVAACGGETAPADEPTKSVANTDFPLVLACARHDAVHWDVVTPSDEWDGFEVRRVERFSPDGGTTSVKRTMRPLCQKATDAAACEALAASAGKDGPGWDELGPTNGGNRPSQPELVVATRGDEVKVIGTLDELGSAIAPIESAAEAAVLAKLRHGYRPYCLSEDTEVTAARAVGDAFELILRRHVGCAGHQDEAIIRVERDGTSRILSERVAVQEQPNGPVCGRRPDGLAPLANVEPSGIAGLLARMAWLEAASVPAFAALARDLARHGAPPELVERALSARSDEIMHARLTREAARRHGASPERPRIARAKPRSLFELALENAVEGCVREAFGALVATHQAQHASDPALRAMFATIAEDETEHAALSLDLAEWIAPQLSESQRAALARAREEAFAELAVSLDDDPSGEEVALGGMPTRATANRLLEALRDLEGSARTYS